MIAHYEVLPWEPMKTILNSGLYLYTGIVLAIVIAVYLLLKFFFLSFVAKKYDFTIWKFDKALIATVAILIIVGFFYNEKDLSLKKADYQSLNHPIAIENLMPDISRDIYNSPWIIKANKRICPIFNDVASYVLTNYETEERYALEYFDAKKERYISTLLAEKLQAHKENHDKITRPDDDIIVVTDETNVWIYVREQNRLEIFSSNRPRDISSDIKLIQLDLTK